MNNSVDIRPKLGDILNGYQRLSYRPETAIAEFVDNSTASYYENQALFDILGETLFIDIVYDPSQSVLEITDNVHVEDIDGEVVLAAHCCGCDVHYLEAA